MYEPIEDSGPQSLNNYAIWALHLTITLRVWHRGIINFDARVYTKIIKLTRSELSPITSSNIIWHTKPVHDFFDEFYHLGCYDWSGRLYFEPFHEFIHCHKDVCESTFSFIERTYQIQPPCGERPGNRYGLQLTRQYVFLASEKLATFTSTDWELASDTTVGQKDPCLYALPMRDLAPTWLPHILAWMSCNIAHP
jgi:hypothetical protein